VRVVTLGISSGGGLHGSSLKPVKVGTIASDRRRRYREIAETAEIASSETVAVAEFLKVSPCALGCHS
jgi:hypothetical protein